MTMIATKNGTSDGTPAMDTLGAEAQNTAKAEHNYHFSNMGPQNAELVDIHPNSFMPPPTDEGSVVPIWYSFDLTHRRVQAGGWTHQVTSRELPSSKDLAGVNMRLTAGSFRELHWHLADEWAIMVGGNARVTLCSPDGTMFVDDVAEGDLWMFPAGYPHSIQGMGEDGCEFLLVFNQGDFSEEDTFLISDWLMHTPPEILEKNFSVDEGVIAKIAKKAPLYIFPSTSPTQSLEQDRAEAERRSGKPKEVFTFKASRMQPTYTTPNGHVKVIDQSIFPASKKICTGISTVRPGGMREMHWHPTASEWQFWIKGQGRMTVFPGQSSARTADFKAGDVGFVPKMAGHYVENTGSEDAVFLEMFAVPDFADISLSKWLRALPQTIAAAHTNFSADDLAKIPYTNTLFK